nr:leishmanolysin-like peptidase 2 [Manis javanica]
MLLLLLLVGAAASRCLHDETQKSVSLLTPHFSQLPPNFRSSSLTLPGPHYPQPLRIQTCYIGDPVSHGLWDSELQGDRMRGGPRALAAVREAAQRLHGVLAVPPVQGPLLLSRDPAQYCHAVWGDPDTPNYHRCSLLNPRYKGESCLGAKIPDAHLHGYALWPEQGPPQLVQPDGPGVPNTDFLLYVRVAHTSKCHGQATLHELLHVLGFSAQLFKKWRDCPSGPRARENCSTRPQVTRRDEGGQLLLTTPTVSHRLAQHLGVLGGSLGVPLEEEGPLSSHWEARLLQGSIMTATFNGAQRTQLDPITLAAFKDSGWYQVNHRAAEELLWGQGSGLEFGLVSTCGTGSSDFFCTGRGLGCHYLHLDKGSCSSDPMLEGCRMYKPLANRSECWKKENGFPPGAENPHGEIYHSQSRCFLANLTSQLLPGDKTRHPSQIPHLKESELTGRCYLHQCTDRGTYKVQVEGSPWAPCPPGKAIQIPGYRGLLLCPRGRLCQTNESTNAVTSPPVSLSTQHLLFELSLGLAGPPSHYLGKEERDELAEAVLQALVNRGGTGRCYFQGASITTSLVFTVHMWKSPGCQGPSVSMLKRALTLTLQKKPLEVYYGGASFTTEYIKLPVTLDHNPSMTHTGVSMGLCLMLLILLGALGIVVYQKQAALRVGPSAPYPSPELQGTRAQSEE